MKKDGSKANIWPGHSKMTFKQFKKWYEGHYTGDVEEAAKKLGIKVPSKTKEGE
jgi:hypothetical protein